MCVCVCMCMCYTLPGKKTCQKGHDPANHGAVEGATSEAMRTCEEVSHACITAPIRSIHACFSKPACPHTCFAHTRIYAASPRHSVETGSSRWQPLTCQDPRRDLYPLRTVSRVLPTHVGGQADITARPRELNGNGSLLMDPYFGLQGLELAS